MNTSRWKIYLILILVIVIIGIGVYGYYWYTNIIEIRDNANKVIQHSEQLSALVAQIKQEKARCEELISQGEGRFGAFEYCNNFLEWQKKLDLTIK